MYQRPSDTKKLIKERTDALRSRKMHYQRGFMDTDGDLPTLIGKLKVDWIDFPFDDILRQLTTLKEGILRGVFRQKAAGAWFGRRAPKAQITVLLPGGSDLSSWLDKVDCMSHSWPKSCNISQMQTGAVHAKTFHLHRKFTRARHMWLSLRPNWHLLQYHMYTDWPGIYTYEESMIDYSSTLGAMTTSMIPHPRRGGGHLHPWSGSANSSLWRISWMPRLHRFG